MQRWRTLLQHKIPDFNRLEVLISANRYDGLINLYVTNNFETKLDALTTSTRLAFIDKFYNLAGANLAKVLANKELITYFARFYDDLATRAAFYKLSPTKMLEFLEDYGNASSDVTKKFRKNPLLFNDWSLISKPLLRKDMIYLISYNYAKKTYVIDKLCQIMAINGKWVGGHLGVEAFDLTKPIRLILDNGVIPLSKQVGTRTYKQVTQTSFTMTDGVKSIRKKGVHTWIEGLSKSDFIEDIAFALTNSIKTIERLGGDGAREILFKSQFQDGTNVTLIIREPHWIDEFDDVFSNHLSAIIIEPEF